MSQPERRHFSAEEHVKILRMRLVEGKAVSSLCEQGQINPSLFCQWQRVFSRMAVGPSKGADFLEVKAS